MNLNPAIWHFLITVWLGLQSYSSAAASTALAETEKNLPAIALIIDDLGNQQHLGMRAVMLPGPVACAFLPYGPFTNALARQAHGYHKEVMLHLPMQAVDHENRRVEKGTLTLEMTEQQFMEATVREIAAVPYVTGLNNAEAKLAEARAAGDFSLVKHWSREAAFHGSGHLLHNLFWPNMIAASEAKAAQIEELAVRPKRADVIVHELTLVWARGGGGV